jgi:AcrR family transcriptional regulator
MSIAAVRTPRSTWVAAGLRALAAGGPDAVRIEPLAESLGVSKGGFYWHFSHRSALLEEMLNAWEQLSVTSVIETIEGESGDAPARLWRLFERAMSDPEMLSVDIAIRDWSLRDADVAARLRRVDTRRMDYMRSLFGEICSTEEEVEARCLLAFSLFLGSHFIVMDHGARTREQVLKDAAAQLIS